MKRLEKSRYGSAGVNVLTVYVCRCVYIQADWYKIFDTSVSILHIILYNILLKDKGVDPVGGDTIDTQRNY
jgi:hypothetical protein